jgi:hypothetical protein
VRQYRIRIPVDIDETTAQTIQARIGSGVIVLDVEAEDARTAIRMVQEKDTLDPSRVANNVLRAFQKAAPSDRVQTCKCGLPTDEHGVHPGPCFDHAPVPDDVCHVGAACSKDEKSVDEFMSGDDFAKLLYDTSSGAHQNHAAREYRSLRARLSVTEAELVDMRVENSRLVTDAEIRRIDGLEHTAAAVLKEKAYWAMIFEDVINEQMRGLPRKKNGSP